MSLTGIGEVADAVTSLVGKFFPDKTAQEQQQLALVITAVQGQLDTNKVEAASTSIFIGGWRPFIGWVCGAALVYTYIGYPLLLWAGSIWFPAIVPPKLGNDGMLFELMLGMLGLGGLRTFEKVKGVAT